MSDFERIFENNRAWVGRKLAANPEYFAALARGQQPRFLYIGCSDSRVTAEEIMGVEPGELFVQRCAETRCRVHLKSNPLTSRKAACQQTK